VKRAALLILLVGAPLALVLFPGFRRRLANKLRFLLLVWSGAVLFFGLMGGPGKKNFFERVREGDAQTAWALLGVALFAAAFVSVLRDFRLSSPPKKSPGGAQRR
jgi:membrane protease YdiL (CAAX protease family)